ncbi:MAG: TolC family protein [Bdellovibrionales bacterium]|nr:TolC family protein [Bdellovibrionales bacterium]
MIFRACSPGIVIAATLLVGCSPYAARVISTPPTEVPETFSGIQPTGPEWTAEDGWWRSFGDGELNSLVELALENNYELGAAWSRLAQVAAQQAQVSSAQYPQLTVEAGAARTRTEDGALIGLDGRPLPTTTFYTNNFFVRNGLSFEVDLWRRIANRADAAHAAVVATRADAEQTALLLSGTVVDLWLEAQEASALLALLAEQQRVNETLLRLTELRYSVGTGSALDVLQQRQQLAAIRAEVPQAEERLARARTGLATITGQAPEGAKLPLFDGALPGLPPFPAGVTPISLLDRRPDLRAAQAGATSAEFELASRIADRLPRLTVGLTYEFSARDIGDAFTRQLGNMAANATLPLIDGGRRRAAVREQEAVVDERLQRFGAVYLRALEEVENSVAAERHRREFVERLKEQVEAATATLRESRARYINGVVDYVQVILAVQGLQQVERRLLAARRGLLSNRAELYRALGGQWTQQLPAENVLSRVDKEET